MQRPLRRRLSQAYESICAVYSTARGDLAVDGGFGAIGTVGL